MTGAGLVRDHVVPFPVDRQGSDAWLEVDGATPLGELVGRIEVLDRLATGDPGLTVVENGARVGFLPAYVIERELTYPAVHRSTWDESLPGETVLPLLVIVCPDCGARNELRSYDMGRTQCLNGHPLAVDWA